MTQLISNMHETGEWRKGFIEVRVTALKRSPKLQNTATITQSASSQIQQR
jgi:hypothetical protein